jgi:transposase
MGKEIIEPWTACPSLKYYDCYGYFIEKAGWFLFTKKQGHTILFLPPYLPELNLIERFWGWLKSRLRSILHLFDSFDDALADCFKVG